MANLQPDIFRPSAVVRMTLRFEEYDDNGALQARLPPLAPGAQPAPNPLVPTGSGGVYRVQDPGNDIAALTTEAEKTDDALAQAIQLQESGADVPEGYIQALREAGQELEDRIAGASADNGPMDYVGGPSPDERVITVQFVPVSIAIERNALRTADTATITLDYKDVPTDARLIRGSAVEIVVGLVDPLDFENGVLRNQHRDSGALMSYIESGARNATRFVGVVDTWKTEYDESGGDVVTIECRDFSALLIDTPLATGTSIDLTQPIDEGIRSFLNNYPTVVGIKVFYGRPGDDGAGAPVPSTAAPQSTRPRRGRGARQRRSGDQNTSLWDHITDTCMRVGLIPVFYDYDLRILDPRTFYSNRDIAKRMVYGENLRHFEVSRKLGGVRVPTIEVRCYDPDLCRTRWARYPVADGATADQSAGVFGQNDPPQRPSRPNEVSVSGWTPDERIQTYVVKGVTSLDVLRRIARSLFEQIGRQEIEGNIQTDQVQSTGPAGPTDQADLLHLTSGDAIEILIAGQRTAPASTAGLSTSELAAMERQRRTDYLVSIGWRREVAERFSAFADATSFQTIFRIQDVRIEMDAEEGLTFSVDFVNFITVREEAQTNPESGTAAEVSTRTVTLPEIRITSGPQVVELDEIRVVESTAAARDRLQQQRADGVISDEQYQSSLAQLDDEDSAAQDVATESG